MRRSTEHRWLDRFAWTAAGATFLLIGLGGLVTSKGAGMAVPDWPTTYGYNMFLFPVHLWTGGIFYEHTHRLFASFVGLLTTILAAWLWVRDSRRWLRWLGVVAFLAVVVQGLLGGLRVTLFKDELGIVHATLAQAFLVLVSLIALASSGRAAKLTRALQHHPLSGTLRWMTAAATVLILAQLVLGATMRHQHAGLAIPDFPLAYGKLWPPMDAASIDLANRQRIGIQEFRPITAFQIGLHMAHRAGAVLILALVCTVAWKAAREQGTRAVFARLARTWAWLIGLQAALGAMTVWSNKAADVATAHVLLGAASLLLGSILTAGIALARAEGASRVDAGRGEERIPGARLVEMKPAGT
jgi:cytochrome c oxidase assembly protein subunit 15